MTTHNDTERERLVSDFVHFMRQKGYRRPFALVRNEHSRDMHQGDLKSCLEKFLSHFDHSGGKENELRLDTYAAFASPSDNIHCSFIAHFDPADGFSVRQLSISHAKSNDRRMYRFVSNHQIPGSGAVQGLFPKPKPWDHLLKGRFRP